MPPLVLVAVAWLAGLVVAHHWPAPSGVPTTPLLLLSLLPLALLVLWWRDRDLRLAAFCALALLAATLRYDAVLPDWQDPDFVARYNDDGWVRLEGVVAAYPDARDTWTNLTLEVEAIEIEGQRRVATGQVLVRAPRYPAYAYGDRLWVSGLMETPPELEGFSYREYLGRQGIHSLIYRPQIEKVGEGEGSRLKAALFDLKDRAYEAMGRLAPDPEAALLQGIVLGAKTGIPKDLYDEYNTTGTSHIIVISGANITVVAALFALVFGRLLGKRRAYWLTVAGISLYVVLVGADMAVVRAGLMGGLFVTAGYLGRRSTAYVSLLASAMLLTFANPLALWDVGFQLSFASTLSLILFTPPLERGFQHLLGRFLAPERAGQATRLLNEALIVTLAAQMLTLPLVAYHFGRLSLVSPLANFLILPVQPPVMALGGLAAGLGVVPALEPLARAVAWLPWLCLAYTNTVVHWLAGWPAASVPVGGMGLAWLAAGYAVLGGGLGLGAWRRRGGMPGLAIPRLALPGVAQSGAARALHLRGASRALLGVGAAAAVLAWLAVLQLPDGKLHVAFLDVGQGDAILITTPQGQQVLVDGGPSPAALTAALGKEMPFWDRSLDLVVLTHPDADHLTGLVEVLDRYQVDAWLDNGQAGDDALYAQCRALLEQAGVPRRAAQAGERLELGEGLALEVLHPPAVPLRGTESDDNNNSLVLRLAWGEAGFLLAGDVEAEAEAVLLREDAVDVATVLKVAHHGSRGASTVAWLAAVVPRYAVISVGAENRFDHPHEEVLDRLAGQGVAVLRTDQVGTVEFVTDGRRMWVRTER